MPIYVSYLTFSNMLDWLKDMGTVPSKFDRSLWGKKFGGATGGQLVSGMKFLGLLDGDNTMPALEQLAMADTPSRKALVAQLLRSVYGSDLLDGLPKMTPKMLSDRFTELGSTESTRRKAVAFFINAAKAADVPLHPQLAKQARNRPSVTRRPSGSRGRPGQDTPAKQDLGEKQHQPRIAWTDRVDPTVLSWLHRIPARDEPWPADERERWHNVLTAILDGIYDEGGPEGE